jgi:hypothetical protein
MIKFRVVDFKNHFQQYLSYIMVVNFICGGNLRKPLTNFITGENLPHYFRGDCL